MDPYRIGLMVFLITKMLIKIDFTAEEAGLLSINEMSFFFSEISRASRFGYHRIIVPRDIAKWASEHLDLSSQDKAHLNRLRGEYTQLAGLADSSKSILCVEIKSRESLNYKNGIFRIGYRELLDGKFLERAVLLLENAMSDGDFFKHVLFTEAKRRSFGEISFEIAHGGGSSTASELERHALENKIIVCICDSDALTPFSKRSETHNSIMRKASKINFIGIATNVPAHEAENILPIDIVNSLSNATCQISYKKLFDLIVRQGETSSGDCLWLYFDIKNGLKIDRLDSVCQDSLSRKWAANKYNVSESALDSVVFSGFGEGLLSKIMSNGAALADFHRFSRTDFWCDNFSPWINEFIWYLCGRQPLRLG